MKYENFVGKILDERYRINCILGVGGMAVVFKAEDLIMNRTVAIKVLKNDSADFHKSIQRFVNESKAVAMLSHPNIVNIYDVNVKDEIKYIVMEYVDGTTLKEYLKKTGGAIPYREALKYTVQILDGLSHAHSKGVVHRDVKPHNMLMLRDGNIKVADFGIAKLPNNETLTAEDAAIGTVHYISPEQANGNEVTASSDIYSVGVMLYEMVTGKLPFDADTPVSIALMHITDEPVKPKEINPDIPDGLQFIITHAMAKNPDDRFESCSEMMKYIKELIKNPDVIFSEKPFAARRSARLKKSRQSKEEEERQNRKNSEPKIKSKRQHHTMMPIIFGVFLSVLIVGIISGVIVLQKIWSILYSTANGDNDTTQYISVENLIGQPYTKALAEELYEKGYRIDVSSAYSEEYEKNVIIAQSVDGGSKRRFGFNMKITVSLGTSSFELKDYRYESYREVQTELKSLGLGLKVQIVQRSDDYIDTNLIIATEPSAGQKVGKGDTVKLIVSTGSEIKYASVPDVTMKSLEEAKAAIENAGFKVGTVTESYDNIVSGFVIHQSVSAGSSALQKFTAIDLEVSKGPDPHGDDPGQEDEDEDEETEEEN